MPSMFVDGDRYSGYYVYNNPYSSRSGSVGTAVSGRFSSFDDANAELSRLAHPAPAKMNSGAGVARTGRSGMTYVAVRDDYHYGYWAVAGDDGHSPKGTIERDRMSFDEAHAFARKLNGR